MDFRCGKTTMNVQGDRLSRLPNDLIHKILSFIGIREAIGTSVLSSRWRFIWKSMPYLDFSYKDFSTPAKFNKFVTHVLSHRDNLTEVYSLKLHARVKASHMLVKRVLYYAFTHNIQQLNVFFVLENDIEFPLSLFSSQSLKNLSLTMQLVRQRKYMYNACFTSTWEFPNLTTLDLHYVTLRDDNANEGISVFSNCENLKNLTLKYFKTIGSNGFNIFHPRLSNLTLKDNHYSVNVINVVAPHLKKLTIKFCYPEHLKISAPDLASLIYEGSRPLCLSTEGFHYLEKADVCVTFPQDADALKLVCLLQQLHSVKFLKINMEIVENLSSSVDLILDQPSPFVNLKSLNIYPARGCHGEQAPKRVAMSTKLKSYLLDGSPRSTFTMVLREEVIAQNLMAELQVLLEKENDNIKTNMAHLERGKAQADSLKARAKKKPKIEGTMEQMKSGWENLLVQLKGRKEKACLIISRLQCIEELLTSMPVSKRAKLQPCFSSMRSEANIAISQITDYMKIQCDENQRRSSVLFSDPDITLDQLTTRLRNWEW